MKFSEKWLREWVNPSANTDELTELLTMAGLEVDSVEPVAAEFSSVVVGEVLSVEPHPDAKKLNICKVNADTGETLQIVCGAPNVCAGMKAPTALVGAKLPGIKIKKAKLRGVESFGMLCSASELGLAESSEGLFALPADAPVGTDIREYLDLSDVSIEVDLTPNRSDCLGVMGIAREIGTLTRTHLEAQTQVQIPATIDDTFPVELKASDACPHYVGRVIRGINNQAPTPLWMQEHLRRSGLRSLSAVVDVTNFVLLELGQPMHAFDLAKLSGGIQVRKAQDKETITLLDGQKLELDNSTLVIADHQQTQALAGIMGGEFSSVTDTTQDIFLESAFFTPDLLAGCARRYGLHTDSSHRFERGVDPALQAQAIERATELLLDIVGGQAGKLVETTVAEHLPERHSITLRATRIERLLGQAIPEKDVEDCLMRLGMEIDKTSDNPCEWHVVPPSFRFDINIEADLIEEVARVYGYNRLPNQTSNAMLPLGKVQNNSVQLLQKLLVERGYQEAITYSFVDPHLQTQLNPGVTGVQLANPLASDMSEMRTSLWTGLMQALVHNQKRQQPDIRLFETGLRFIKNDDSSLRQERMLAGVVSGRVMPEQWGSVKRDIDFFDVKGDLEALLKYSALDVKFVAGEHPALHPGQTAQLLHQDEIVGYVGKLHPALEKTLDLSTPAYLFEIQLEVWNKQPLPVFQSLSKFPAIRRDIAVVVNQKLQIAELMTNIRQSAGEFLTNLQLFDIYQGEGIDPEKKSLALGLTFRASSRNLTESEIDPVIDQVLSKLEQDFDASLRT